MARIPTEALERMERDPAQTTRTLVEAAERIRVESPARAVHDAVRKLLQAYGREQVALGQHTVYRTAETERALAFHGLGLTNAIEEVVECLGELVVAPLGAPVGGTVVDLHLAGRLSVRPPLTPPAEQEVAP